MNKRVRLIETTKVVAIARHQGLGMQLLQMTFRHCNKMLTKAHHFVHAASTAYGTY